MRYRSEVDLWYRFFLCVPLAIVVVSAFAVPESERPMGLGMAVLITAFMLWLVLGTYYEFRDDHLYCRSGPFFERIPYDKIKSIRPTENLFSSMALSRKRLEIRQHGKGFILGTTMISPENRDEFLRELRSRCGNLES